MKITLPNPVVVTLPNGETIQYSVSDMVEHIARNGREFGRGNDVEKVRQGARLLAAFASTGAQTGEITAEDLEALKAAVSRPSCGWSGVKTKVKKAIGYDKSTGKEIEREVDVRVAVSALELLPLIDAITNA